MAVQLGPGPPEKVRLTGCGVVVRVPFVPKIRELGNRLIVTLTTVPDWLIATVCPATLKDPTLLLELLFALTDQATASPETVALAQDTLELAVGLPQGDPLGVTVIVPDPPAAPTLRLLGLNV